MYQFSFRSFESAEFRHVCSRPFSISERKDAPEELPLFLGYLWLQAHLIREFEEEEDAREGK